MQVDWVTEEPPVDEVTRLSRQLVVLTSCGHLNTAYWSAKRNTWFVDGLMAGKEFVVGWLRGLELPEAYKV